jgi:hypothetical protein
MNLLPVSTSSVNRGPYLPPPRSARAALAVRARRARGAGRGARGAGRGARGAGRGAD